jgi:prepilin-type processing-associated H-X9-DG protein
MISDGWPEWWDMPSNRHEQGADLSFADGHVEYWHWRAPMVAAPGGGVTPVTPELMFNYSSFTNVMRWKPLDGTAD